MVSMEKKKEEVAIFSTDWHIKRDNIDIIIDLVRQQCLLAVELKVKYLACLGDVFDSRIAQTQDVLDTFSVIVDMVSSYGLTLVCIPGNHDKTNYDSSVSFLSPYKGRKGLFLIEMAGSIPFKDSDFSIDFIPFFKEEVWIEQFNQFQEYLGSWDSIKEDSKKRILCTHIAVTGSRNNDGSMVSSKLSTSLFKNYFKVFSGHYHDQQKIGENFYHIPSIRQNNFGENSDKGFTVLYSDGSHELVKSKFVEFKKVKIDLGEYDLAQIKKMSSQYSDSNLKLRFELTGTESQLKSINIDDFPGVQITKKSKEIESDIEYAENNEVVEMTVSTIREEFVKFCNQENIDMEIGIKFINKLNNFK